MTRLSRHCAARHGGLSGRTAISDFSTGCPPHTSLDALRFLRNLDSMLEGLQVIGFDWRYVYVNDLVCRHGRRRREDLLGRTMMEAYPGIEKTEVFAFITRCMHERTPHRMENEFDYGDGTTGWFELSIEPAPEGVLILSIDITERKHLERQLRHAQKMDAIGRLAGGVAHDFNNLLTIIQSFGGFVLESLGPDDPARDDMEQVLEASKRAESLTRQLLAFSRQQPVRHRVVAIGDLVGGMERMLRRLVDPGIEMTLLFPPGLWSAEIDVGGLEQALVNLVVNARDAMPDGGQLVLEGANARLDAPLVSRDTTVPAGEYVLLTVTDDGVGMPPEVQDRLFEPFFSTKAEGTGLGLATCHGVVRQVGGHLRVRSEPGRGTSVAVYLPRARVE